MKTEIRIADQGVSQEIRAFLLTIPETPLRSTTPPRLHTVSTKDTRMPEVCLEPPHMETIDAKAHSKRATVDDQIVLERQSLLRGYQRFIDRSETLRSQGQAGESVVGQEVQYLLVNEVAGHIGTMIEEARSPRKSGRKASWFALVHDLDVHALAVETLSVGWSVASGAANLQGCLVSLGSAAEVQAEMRTLMDHLGEEKARKAVQAVVRTKPQLSARKKALHYKAAKVGHTAWTTEQRVQVGGMLWNALCLTGLFEAWTLGADATTKFVGLTPRGEQLALELTHSFAWSRPILVPTLVPPKPWSSLDRGAYYTRDLQRRVTLVRTRSKRHREAVKAAVRSGQMRAIQRVVDAIGATAFALRPEAVDLVRWAWSKGLQLKKIPTRTKVPVPLLPWDLEYMCVRQKGKLLARHYKAVRYNRGVVSNAAAMRRDLETAEWLSGLPEFYLPHSLDFRGRVYPIPSYNHQRSDYVKGTFRFARGQRLGAEGLYWLKVHVANTGDFDKVSKRSFDDRVFWVHDNLDLVRRVAADPKTHLEWTKADKPFSFFHACLELNEALSLENPEDYVSHIPVDLDGSNSGVQHYAAALRADEGEHVNLVPLSKPADLYGVVAERVRAYAETVAAPEADLEVYRTLLVSLEAAKDRKDAAGIHAALVALEPMIARLWLDFGLTRSVVKRPTMTRGYGSETFGFRNQVIEDLMEPLDVEVMTGQRAEHPFGADTGRQAASWLAKRIWQTLGEVLKKTSEGMAYLQEVARILASEGHGVSWTTKLGFPVVQRYEEPELKSVDLWLYDRTAEIPEVRDAEVTTRSVLRRYQVRVQTGSTGVLVKHRQANAIAPNLIHSQDATHLLASVRRAYRYGIRDFLLVHDSFGTHAANIGLFGRAIREAFVVLYRRHDPFREFHRSAQAVLEGSGVQLPEPPTPGSLVLQDVLAAQYAFA
ncbi:RPO41 Mitochondrial DNA-directed RNA polymerase [uncultured Caudovirales phage]|uniref:DNA-directed RNA polymerase n=1 Tax=uncultured Caudovirales phage TaxID=2100421 RepID=A0A6J5NMQ5_9CAUD|nr:RPO41 Mitochondrial DNA-directed RNA polymerase [uncultured Caudovirales phage]